MFIKGIWITHSMTLLIAASLMVPAVAEAVSLVWMDLALFVVSFLICAFFSGWHSTHFVALLSSWKSGSKIVALKKGFKSALGDGTFAATSLHSRKNLQMLDGKTQKLVHLVNSMQRAGRRPCQIMADLRIALKDSPSLLSSLQALPAVFLRNEAVDLLDGMLALLSEHGITSDADTHAYLMRVQMRRRDWAAVAATASRMPAETITPEMRAMLANGAIRRGRLDEALGHLHHIPTPAEGTRPVIGATATAQILALATREQRIVVATEALQRVRAKLMPKQLEKLFEVKGRACGSLVCRELFTSAEVLKVRRTEPMFQVYAGALGQAGDKEGLHDLIRELQADASGGRADIVVEPLTMALLDACKAVRDGSMLPQVLELHRTMCEKAPCLRILEAFCSALIACDRAKEALEHYEHELLPKGALPDAVLTNSLLKAAARCGSTALAKRLAYQTATGRPTVSGGSSTKEGDLRRHAILIKAYGCDGNFSGASQVVARLKKSGIPLTSVIHNCYLDVCVQCGEMDVAERQFVEMKEAGLIDAVGYNTMLMSHLARGRPDEALALLQEMAARGLQADKVTFNELPHAKVVAKDTKGVWSLTGFHTSFGLRHLYQGFPGCPDIAAMLKRPRELSVDGNLNGQPPGTLEEGVLALAPPASFWEAAQEAMAKVDEAVKQVFGDEARVLPYGSLIQGLALECSDVDLCVEVPGDLGCNHDENSSKQGNSVQVSLLQRLMGKLTTTGRFQVMETRFWKNTKVPIIILRFASSQGQHVETGISFGADIDGVKKGLTDRVVRRLLACSPRTLHMARLVKLWAHATKLNKAYDGFLNSLGWTLLVLHFFMEKGEIASDVVNSKEPDELEQGGDNSLLPPALHDTEDPEAKLLEVPSQEDVAEFFEWVATTAANWPDDPPGGAWGISIVEGTFTEVPTPEKKSPEKKSHDTCRFYLEDPGPKLAKSAHQNVACSLKAGPWKTTLDRCKGLSDKLRAQSPKDASAWFAGLLHQIKAEAEAADAAAKHGVQWSWATTALTARPGITAPKASTPQVGGMQGSRAASAGSGQRTWTSVPQSGVGELTGRPAAKRVKTGVVCNWFLKGQCWDGDRCPRIHSSKT